MLIFFFCPTFSTRHDFELLLSVSSIFNQFLTLNTVPFPNVLNVFGAAAHPNEKVSVNRLVTDKIYQAGLKRAEFAMIRKTVLPIRRLR